MISHETFDSKSWKLFIRVIVVLGIPVGSWIVKTTMNTDKNVAIVLTQISSMENRVRSLENKSDVVESRYVEDLKEHRHKR